MATIFSEAFTGANGVAISSSNTAFSSVINAPTFSTAVKKSGTASAYCNTNSSYSYMEYTHASTTSGYWSFYVRPVSAPSANTVIFYVGNSSAAIDRIFQVTLNTNLTLKLQQGSSATIVGSNTTGTLPLNEWSRIDVAFASNTLYLDIYPGDTNCDANSGTAIAGNRVGGSVTTVSNTYLYLGVGNGTTNQLYFDEFRADNTTLPGPIGGGGGGGGGTTFSEPFDGGANGVTLSTSNTAFDSVINAPTFSTSVAKKGTGSAYFNVSDAYAYLERTFTSTTTRYWSFYIRPVTAPSVNTPIFFAGTAHGEATRVFQVTLNTNLSVKLQQGSGATIVGSNTTSTLPLNQWSRIDVLYNGGSLNLHLYAGDANCDAAINTATGGNVVGGSIGASNISYLYLGVGSSSTTQLYIDEFREDSASIPAPVEATVILNPYLYYDTGSAWVDVTDQLYYDNGTSWVQIEVS